MIDVSVHGVQTTHPAVSATPTAPDVDVIEDVVEEENVPKRIELLQNYPNPFNPKTKIRVNISNPENNISPLNLSIYNINGQLIKTLYNGPVNSRRIEFEWDGTNDLGWRMAGGVYVYTLKMDNVTQSRKMLLLK